MCWLLRWFLDWCQEPFSDFVLCKAAPAGTVTCSWRRQKVNARDVREEENQLIYQIANYSFSKACDCASRRLLEPPWGQFQVTLSVKITERELSTVGPPAHYSPRAGWSSGLIPTATAAGQQKGRSHRPCTPMQPSTNVCYVTERLSTLAQCRAGLQHLAVSRE